jgi:hypothetical protein
LYARIAELMVSWPVAELLCVVATTKTSEFELLPVVGWWKAGLWLSWLLAVSWNPETAAR